MKTFVDSGILIEAYRGSTSLAISALSVITDATREFVTSDFVRLEVLPKATYQGRQDEIDFYMAFFDGATLSIPTTTTLVRRAFQIAETFGLSAVDALHVAAAERANADELVTAERPTSPLTRVTTIRVISIRP
jgi:predicted nucleic acid-binding protein